MHKKLKKGVKLLISAIGFFAISFSVQAANCTTFTKIDYTDWTQPENQDRITDNVWITRGGFWGIFNIQSEIYYSPLSSPADTEWFLRARNFNARVDLLPELLVYRRIHGNNRSHHLAEQSRHEYLKLVKASLDLKRVRQTESRVDN